MINSSQVELGQVVERIGSAALRAAETTEDNQIEAETMDAIACVLAGRGYDHLLLNLPAEHPVQLELSKLASALQVLLDNQA